jgi:glucose 1-dehydrogenase
MDMPSLDGRFAVVTGAGSGNGAAIARRFRENGARVVLLDSSRENLERTLASWPEELRSGSDAAVADITIDADVESAFADIERLDILVNNAGIAGGTSFPELDIAEFRNVVDVNLFGAYRCSRAAHRLLTSSRFGRVINITSIEAHYLLATRGHVQPHYNASKAALDHLTRALAFELAPFGVTVNAIAPGVVDTPFTKAMLQDPERRQWLESHTPLGRVGRPEDVAAVASFLASDNAAFVTGQTIFVDGGFTLGWYRRV